MSDDLVKRLRFPPFGTETSEQKLMASAADLIEAQAAEIARLRADRDNAMGYLSRLLKALHPTIEPLPDLLGVCTQVDNVQAGQRQEIARLRADLAAARLEGMEKAISEAHARAEFWMSGNNAEAETRYDELRKTIAAIRAAAKEGK